MKVVRLRVAGFGPYRAEQAIDFRPFDEAGIFLITGRTGAGKSSILDAVCFALYGSVPRFEGRDLGVRSQHCGPDEETFAELDFTVRGTTYRIRQSPRYERPSRRGGLTTQAATVSFSVQEGAGWRTLATKAGEAAALLQEVLPLKRDQFLQVVLLAQGRFQEFLLAPTDKRRQVLRTLFRTDRFEALEEALQERRKELEARAAATDRDLAAHAATVAAQCGIEEPIEPDLEWFETAWVGLEDRVEAAAAARAAASDEVAAAEVVLRDQEAVRAAQLRRGAAVQRLAALAEEEPAVQGVRAALARAELAERVRPLLDRRDVARRECTAAEAGLAEAEEVWAGLGGAGDAGESADALLTALGALEPALAAERDLTRRTHEAAGAAAARATANEALTALERRELALPAALDALEPRLAAATLLAGSRQDREERVQELVAVVAAAERAAALAADAAAAAEHHGEASAAAARVAAEYDGLVRRRLAGAAAELAGRLVPGEPCAVCGSPDHPAPAEAADDPVSEADLEAAKRRALQSRARLDAAVAAAGEILQALEGARAQAGGRVPAEAAASLDAARVLAAEAVRAEAEQAALAGERERLRAELVDVRRAATAARDERDRLAAAAASAEAAVREAASGVAAARAGFPTVAARRDRLRREQEAARAVVIAVDAAAVARRSAADAHAALELQLAAAGFADEAEATRALLGVAERDAAVRRVREHDDALARDRGTLAEPELADLPEEPLDPAAAREAVQRRRSARDDALATESAVRDRLASVTARLAEVRALLRAGDRVREEYLRVRELAQVVSGSGSNTMRMRLETYVLAAYLEDVLAAANGRLAAMTGRRYALVLDDGRQHRNVETGLGVTVLDAHTGEARQAASLSGGETFLASLALALGLAEVVSAQAGGVTLDTLFVDEGFGSLDVETLDVALAALEDLRAGGRTIGLISHVESMRERIPAKLAVTVLPSGASAVESAPALV